MRSWKKALLCLWLALAVCLSACAVAESADAPVRMLFINVGKADAAVVWVGERTYLIDTADKDSYPALKQALEAYQITHFDAILISHIDKDHVGGLALLLQDGFTTDQLYAATFHGKKKLEKHPVYKAAEEYQLPLDWLDAGDAVAIAGAERFRVLGPLRQDEENENNNSLVLLLETAQGTALFPGDMELQEEADLLEAGAFDRLDVLKVAHHGEDDTGSELFIYTVRPKLAVISTSSAEEPDTPDNKIISRLMATQSQILVTQTATCGVLVRLEAGEPSAFLINYEDMP